MVFGKVKGNISRIRSPSLLRLGAPAFRLACAMPDICATACFLLLLARLCACADHLPSGPVTINGQNGVVIRNVHITSTTGNCLTITKSTNITIENSEIGPCGTDSRSSRGNGISMKGNNGVYIYDNYIHVETATNTCCDRHDGVMGEDNRNVTIQGNVIAYGESNIEFTNRNASIIVTGNFLLNPRGPQPRGQNFQCWGAAAGDNVCSSVIVANNYALSSLDTTKYLYPENQEDSINFGHANGAIVRNNYITGGHAHSGCGLIADDGANNMRFEGNLLLNTGQCGIGIASGTNQLVIGNKIYNSTPVVRGGNTAIYTWKQYARPCGPTRISNNIADMIVSFGQHNAYWDGGGCRASLSNNTYNAAAHPLLTPSAKVFPAPLIPPQPKECIATSPYTTNTTGASGLPLCSDSAFRP
jgi:hypothetical protein